MAKKKGTGLARDARRVIQRTAKQAAIEIMNDLGKAGPKWSGEFQDSWVADAVGVKTGGYSSYPYNNRSVPSLPDTVKATQREVKYNVFNRSDHALEAMDLIEGKFYQPSPPPANAREGERQDDIRGKLGMGKGNFATADLDWFMTYLDGGGLQKSLAKGVKLGFKPGGK